MYYKWTLTNNQSIDFITVDNNNRSELTSLRKSLKYLPTLKHVCFIQTNVMLMSFRLKLVIRQI